MKCLQTGRGLTECIDTTVHMDVKYLHKIMCEGLVPMFWGQAVKGSIMQCGFGVCSLASLLHVACSWGAIVVLTKHGNEVCVCDDDPNVQCAMRV